MKCSNCLSEGDDVVLVSAKRKYYACPKCIVTYGRDRDGSTFFPNDEVYIKPGYHSACNGRIFIITGIFIFEECESGRLVTLKDKETGNPFKSELDINWLTKIKN
jgi:hypothetical protein